MTTLDSTATRSTSILLPSSPDFNRLDRFSLTSSQETDDGLVPFFDIVRAILTNPGVATYVGELVQQLDAIAVTLHDDLTSPLPKSPSKTPRNFDFLRRFLLRTWDCQTFFRTVWPAVLALAFEMPQLFPDGCIPVLHPQLNPSMVFSRRQIACLVAHQFLGTFPAPRWMRETAGNVDFAVWYEDEPVQFDAVAAYMTALFTYLEKVATEPGWLDMGKEEWGVEFTLRALDSGTSAKSTSNESTPTFTPIQSSDSSPPPDDQKQIQTRQNPTQQLTTLSQVLASDPEHTRTPLQPLEFIAVPEPSTDVQFMGMPDGAAVVFANRQVGFGVGGTMEEIVVGCTPEAYPIVLFTPPLGDAEVLVVRGVEAMVVMEGYGRTARLTQVLRAVPPDKESPWRNRTMLFMDALELDGYSPSDTLPDLLPGHVDRELRKAYTAFSSGPYAHVNTGLWGCGAFGGNDQVKTMIQWCAASFAGLPLRFTYSDDRSAFVARFRPFVDLARRDAWTAEEVIDALKSIRPDDREGNQAPLAFVMRVLSGSRS